nr:hypothetical protein Iba_chr04fCG14710 [Ipomoea batatas]
MQVPTTTAVSLTIESELRVVFVSGFVEGNCAFEGPSALVSVPPLQSLVADIDDYEIGNCLTSFSRLARAMAWLWDVMDKEETVVDNVSILSNCNSKALTDFCKALMADSAFKSAEFREILRGCKQAGGSSPSSNVHNIKGGGNYVWVMYLHQRSGLSTGSPPPGGIRTTFIDCAALSSDATSKGVAMQVPTTTAVSLTIESELRVVFVGGLLGAIVLLKVLVLLGSVPPLQSLVAEIDDYEIGYQQMKSRQPEDE